MSKRLLEQSWMHTPELCALFDTLERARPACVRFVGGCVRDAVRGSAVGDIDLAVQLAPDKLLKVLEESGVSVVPVGLAHGVVRVRCGGRTMELASLRRDVRTDGRHAEIACTQDWEEDAARRDFRCNAVYADREGVLFDPVGGLADIEAGRVVFIGDAGARIREDYLRILRFFRFSAWMSDRLDARGLAAIAENLDGLAGLSAERVRAELFKLLLAAEPVSALEAMIEQGVLTALFGEAVRWLPSRLGHMLEADREAGLEPEALLRLLALIPQADQARDVAYKLKLSNLEQNRLEGALQEFPRRPVSEDIVAAELYWRGAQVWRDRVRLAWADEGGADPAWQQLLRQAQDWTRPEFPLSGEDLLRSGMTEGPLLGGLLARLEREWVETGFSDSRQTLLARAQAQIQD